ncbi:MAG: type IV toxin-antitoxin system AbiEi family antitoxin domain-containing protein [Syntrophobacteraceae bacterium]
MRDSFAGKVRTAAQEFRAAGRTFTSSDLAEKLGVQTYEDKKRAYNTILELVRAKEIQRVSRGVYAYAGKPNQKPSKQKVMWNYFRMRMKCGASITIEELQAAAKVSADYAREWLSFLIGIGYAKDHGNGRFQLLKDPVEMPLDEKKAERLRNLRKRKGEEVTAILDEIRRAFSRLEGAVGDLPD